MATITAGSSKTFTAQVDNSSFVVIAPGGSIGQVVDQDGNIQPIGPNGTRRTFGPLNELQSITVSMQIGNASVELNGWSGGIPITAETNSTGQTVLDDASRAALSASGFSGASQLQRAAQRYKAKHVVGSSRANGVGDSYMVGSGLTAGGTSFFNLLAADLGDKFAFSNYGFGSRPMSAYVKANKNTGSGPASTSVLTPLIDDVTFGVIGFNDVRGVNDLSTITPPGCGTDPENMPNMMTRAQAMATWFMVPESSRVRAKLLDNTTPNPAVTYTGTWNHGGYNGYQNVSFSSAANSTASFTTTPGDLVIIRFLSAYGLPAGLANVSVTIDGVEMFNGSFKSTFDTWAIDCMMFKCASDGPHTVVLKQIAALGNVMFHSADCVDTSTDFSGTFIYSTPGNIGDGAGVGWSLAGAPLNGANAQGATGAAVRSYNGGGLSVFRAAIDEAMWELFELGFNVVNVRVWTEWRIDGHVYTDGVHPNNAGHSLIYRKMRNAFRFLIGL